MITALSGLLSPRSLHIGGVTCPTNRVAATPPPPTPTPITSFPIGVPAVQLPQVLVEDLTYGFDLYTLNSEVASEYPGSIVKLMTVMLAYEYKSSVWTSQTVTVTTADVTAPMGGLSTASLQADDVLTWEGLGYAIFLPSGFDAAQCIARVIGSDGAGTGGMAGFVTLMNARAAALSMTEAVFTDSIGMSRTVSPTVVRNIMSPRDMVKLLRQVGMSSTLLAQSQVASISWPITGPHARSQAWSNFSSFMNGPTESPAGYKDANVLLSKDGVWNLIGVFNYNKATLWQSPSGSRVAIVTISSRTLQCAMLDQRGLMYSLPRDFPYLGNFTAQTDPLIAQVMMLVGADGSIVDNSPIARTLTVTSVTVGSPVCGESTGGAVYNAASDRITTVDAANITIGSQDATAEVWYSGPGASAGERVFFCKDDGSPNREWLVEDTGGSGFKLFISTNGTAWSSVNIIDWTGTDLTCFFNGAPRHIAFVKAGSVCAGYVNGERSVLTITAATIFATGTAPLVIGYSANNVSAPGSYDEFRFTVGTARYTLPMVTLTSRMFPRS